MSIYENWAEALGRPRKEAGNVPLPYPNRPPILTALATHKSYYS